MAQVQLAFLGDDVGLGLALVRRGGHARAHLKGEEAKVIASLERCYKTTTGWSGGGAGA